MIDCQADIGDIDINREIALVADDYITAVYLPPFFIVRPDGNGEGSGHYDFQYIVYRSHGDQFAGTISGIVRYLNLYFVQSIPFQRNFELLPKNRTLFVWQSVHG